MILGAIGVNTSKFFKDKKNCTGLKGKYNLYSLKNLQDSAYYTKLQETSWYFLSIMNMEKPHWKSRQMEICAYDTKLQEKSWYFLSIMNMEKDHWKSRQMEFWKPTWCYL